ncbi:DUF4190 domain-containing protein [Rarobacter incanus]|uniref:Uncharacterized protein DUF4190 n=1 Tax=Rarobacter incanus TaxID=153494 RepID=A0A542SP39_9MICO|nr:DUF4190 domain-containing protein [Rarobacter incanus]TQK76390.1 uncharacterized protein DUF4190 [Rarobacter incanus]
MDEPYRGYRYDQGGAVPQADSAGGKNPYAAPVQSEFPQPGYSQPGYSQPGYSQPGYSQPGYSQPGYTQSGYTQSGYSQVGYAQPPAGVTNAFAIVSLVTAVLGLGPVPVVFGHLALNKINRTGESGRGLAIAGLIIGYLTIALYLLFVVVIVVALASVSGDGMATATAV